MAAVTIHSDFTAQDSTEIPYCDSNLRSHPPIDLCSCSGHRINKTVKNLEMFRYKTSSRDFPGGPVVRTPYFHCAGPMLNSWSSVK